MKRDAARHRTTDRKDPRGRIAENAVTAEIAMGIAVIADRIGTTTPLTANSRIG